MAVIILIININPVIVNAAVYELSSSVEQYRVDTATSGYLVDQSEHFIYKYTPQDEDIIEMVKETTEKSYNELSKVFGTTPKEPVTVIVFPDTDVMNDVLNIPQDQKSMGIYYCGFISVLSPKAWIANNKHFQETFNKTGPMLHELTHLFVDIKTRGNYPAWFTEGVALYFEKQVNGVLWTDNDDIHNEYSIYELANNFDQLDTNDAYIRSYQIVFQYIEGNGMNNLIKIMDRLGEGYSLEILGNNLV